MHSPCAGGASSTPCFNGCFSSSVLASEESHTDDTSVSESRSSGYDFVAATCSTLQPNAPFTNHEALPSLHESYLNFTKAYPLYSNTTLKADQIRAQEYYHLNFSNLCFDYTGYGLFSYAQQQQSCPATSMASSSSSHPPPLIPLDQPFFEISYKSVNLHSQVVYGGEESELEKSTRERIMTFMNFSEDDYTLVFTANQICAFKLLADSFQFTPNGNLLTVYDHKNDSLDEMIKSCNKQGTNIMSAEFSWPDLRINTKKLRKMILSKRDKKKRGVLVFPVHSKVTGSPYSYMWMSMAQENGWHVLLDACSLAPKEMDTLGLSLFKPDFLVCSFYKVFGDNPSGFGCLFVKKSSISALNDSSNATSIGIVSLIPALKKPETISDEEETEPEPRSEPRSSKKIETFGRLEVELRGLDHADEVGLVGISSRGRYLINWVIRALMSLQHPSSETGLPLIKVYGTKINSHRGHAIAFNVFDWKGEKIDPFLVQKVADRNNISLSNAIMQNVKMNEQDWCEVERVGQPRKKKTTTTTTKQDCGISVLTASLNFLTNFEDVYKFWLFISRFLDADFLEKERWKYMALNQQTLEV